MRLQYTNTHKPYKVHADFQEQTKIRPKTTINSPDGFLTLSLGGLLVVREGWHWDGASSLTLPWSSAARPSCAHDAVYELVSIGLLDKKWRKAADKMFRRMLKEDGMIFLQRNLWYLAVRFGGASHTKPEQDVVHTSP